MWRTSLIGVCVAGVLLMISVHAAHAILLEFVPANQSVVIGDPVAVDVVVSGLDEAAQIVSAFDIDVTYESTILSATGVSFGPSLGNPSASDVFEVVDLSSAGVIDIAALSLLPDVGLVGLQGDSVTLATLSFDSVGLGDSALGFVLNQVNDIKGNNNAILDVTPGAGNVSVAPVPVPATAWLLGSGLLGLLGLRALHNRKQ